MILIYNIVLDNCKVVFFYWIYGEGSLISVNLSDLKANDKAVIQSILTGAPGVERLMMMGLVEGTEVTFVRASLGGDPLEFQVYGTALCLRREQARQFTVGPISTDG